MFEKIVLRRSQSSPGPALTIGEVAEALLFYQSVHLVLDYGTLDSLLKGLGPKGLLNLLDRDGVSAVYAEDMFITQNDFVSNWPWHKFHSVTIAGSGAEKQARRTEKGRLEGMLEIMEFSKADARRFAEQFMRRVKVRRFGSDYFVKGGIPKAAYADMFDAVYIKEAMRRVLAGTIGFEPYADNLQLEVIAATKPIGDFPKVPSFTVLTNINFSAGNARRKTLVPALEPVQEGNLLGSIIDVRADAEVASFYGGDFYTSATNSDILRLKYAELLRRGGISATDLQQFRDVVLDNYPTVREVIDGNERSFDEFLQLLDKSSERFKSWIHNTSPDAKLVAEYFKEIQREGWISRLPGKSVRYVLSLGVGIAGLADVPSRWAGCCRRILYSGHVPG